VVALTAATSGVARTSMFTLRSSVSVWTNRAGPVPWPTSQISSVTRVNGTSSPNRRSSTSASTGAGTTRPLT
jgi:hypothetical protein